MTDEEVYCESYRIGNVCNCIFAFGKGCYFEEISTKKTNEIKKNYMNAIVKKRVKNYCNSHSCESCKYNNENCMCEHFVLNM